MVIWITGPPASGKSTLSEAVKKARPEFVILRMDELRKLATPEPSYDDRERDILYRSLVFMANNLSELGHDVIIDATGHLRKWRKLARRQIPGFMEIYLSIGIQTAGKRESSRTKRYSAPVDIYEKGRSGMPVPGLTVRYEPPENPELVIDTELTGLDESAKMAVSLIEKTGKNLE